MVWDQCISRIPGVHLVVQGTVAAALKNSGYFYRIVNAAELLRA